MKTEELIINKNDCCGCGACAAICPQNAISMIEDENGFIYPHIDQNKCISCGVCLKTCGYKTAIPENDPLKVLGATNTNKNQLLESSSGGIFPAIAKYFLTNNAVVYGAAYDFNDNSYSVKHIRINNLEDLPRLQGSKYVQSIIQKDIFIHIKNDLEDNKQVLFSGTPCQIVAIKNYLKKDYKNLYTIDIVCHGVPNQKMFNSYLSYYEKKWKCSIKSFNFRNKKSGWTDFFSKTVLESGKEKIIFSKLQAYYTYFLDSFIYRENCYTCKYAQKNRMGDITLGDFWGIEQTHGEVVESWNNELFNGISCVLINSEKGKYIFEQVKDSLKTFESTYEKVSKYNLQLVRPSNKPNGRDDILKMWNTEGYSKIQKNFKKSMGIKYYYLSCRKTISKFIKKYEHK